MGCGSPALCYSTTPELRVTTPEPAETDPMFPSAKEGSPFAIRNTASLRDVLAIPAVADLSHVPVTDATGLMEGVVNLLQVRAELERASVDDLEQLLDQRIGRWALRLDSPSPTHSADFPSGRPAMWIDSRLYVEWSLVEETIRRNETDPVTQLPGRRAFERRFVEFAEVAAMKRTSLALLLIDLDQFKPINERHGHLVGDSLLASVARNLRNVVPSNGFVGRFGGDEFVILLRRGDPDATEATIRRLLQAGAGEAAADPSAPHVRSLSIGAVLVPGGASQQAPLSLIERADHCLRLAKQGGGARASIVAVNGNGDTVGEPREIQ
jgi:diguanylate cyclase (GGDEF)-like protein